MTQTKKDEMMTKLQDLRTKTATHMTQYPDIAENIAARNGFGKMDREGLEIERRVTVRELDKLAARHSDETRPAQRREIASIMSDGMQNLITLEGLIEE